MHECHLTVLVLVIIYSSRCSYPETNPCVCSSRCDMRTKLVIDKRHTIRLKETIASVSMYRSTCNKLHHTHTCTRTRTRTYLQDLYTESAWLAALVLGVPTLVISCLCYGLCFMEDDSHVTSSAEQRDSDDDSEDDAEGAQCSDAHEFCA